MASGVECAGLVLAMLPIFIEAGKAYVHGTDTLLNIALQSRRDQRLLDFYDHFWWETVELNHRMREIVNALPHLSTQRKVELATAARLEDWTRETDVNGALQNYFSTEDDFNTFMHVMTRLVSLLARLVKDSTIHMVAADADQIQMYNKLKQFASDRDSNQISTRFLERVIFWKEKHRTKCLEQLRIWNKRLGRLIYNARNEPLTKSAVAVQSHSGILKQGIVSDRRVPSVQLRKLSQQLYEALSRCWSCCSLRHEAKFCLKVQEETHVDDEGAVEFDFLVSLEAKMNNQRTWQEGQILVRSQRMAAMDDCVDLVKICDALKTGSNDQRLRLLAEDLNGFQRLWQLRSEPRQLNILNDIPPATLESLLLSKARLSLRDKRRLALILSHSLLQYHESAWLCNEWCKSHISFFYVSKDKPDLRRPYLSTYFETPQPDVKTEMSRFHRNASILALGILLIEIDSERPIETYRTATEKVNVNTDWIVADRKVKSMDQCSEPYKEAVRACLDIPWIPSGQKVRLDDPQTRAGLYTNVIRPLENEFDYLFPKQ